MNIFKNRRTLNISERDPQYKVKYLGNVLTAFMKGEGCVDRPASILWENFKGNENAALDMHMTVCASGLRVVTKEQGLTEYRAHRISYCVCHPQYPRLFIWVYRHEGKRMKVEVRCHAVLCSSEAKAKAIAVHLHDKLAFALAEYLREKTRKQNSRLVLSRANSVPNASAGTNGVPWVPVRIKFLAVGQNFKPPSERSNSAPRLGAISEDKEGEASSYAAETTTKKKGRNGFTTINRIIEENEMEKEEEEEALRNKMKLDGLDYEIDSVVTINTRGGAESSRRSSSLGDTSLNGDEICELEIGNNIDELKGDEKVQLEIRRAADPDTESIESGFSEQDASNDTWRHDNLLY